MREFILMLLSLSIIIYAKGINDKKGKPSKVKIGTLININSNNSSEKISNEGISKVKSNDTQLEVIDESSCSIIKFKVGVPSIANLLNEDGRNLLNNSTANGITDVSVIDDLGDAIFDGSSLFLGEGAGINDDGMNNNTTLGLNTLNYNTTGRFNTAIGCWALRTNSYGIGNTALGYFALKSNIGGISNTGIGINALRDNTNGRFNTAFGSGTLDDNTVGNNNTALGVGALSKNRDGNNNTAVGYNALVSSISVQGNVAVGARCLQYNTTGNNNTAIGTSALTANTVGSYNTALGRASLNKNVYGHYNVAIGYRALFFNESGEYNIAIGNKALNSNKKGSVNTAIGNFALYLNTTGTANTANGYRALYSNSTANNNTANGYCALLLNKIGNNNTAVGKYSLLGNSTGSCNTAIGYGALDYNYTGHHNTSLGYYAGVYRTNLENTTTIGYNAHVSTSNSIRIGNSAIMSISGNVAWSWPSDSRFKRNIKEDVIGLDFILGLRPITYNLDINKMADFLHEDYILDENGERIKVEPSSRELEARQQKAKQRNTGFVAQEVEELAKKLGYNFSGVEIPENENSLYSLRYAEFVVPLVKAVQEQQEMIKELRTEIEELKRAKNN